MGIGENIKQLRLAKGLTQEELGERVGVKKAAIQKYENGTVENLKRSIIQKLADVLEVSPLNILDFEDKYSESHTVAAHREEGNSWTNEELEKIEEYKKLLLAARNNANNK